MSTPWFWNRRAWALWLGATAGIGLAFLLEISGHPSWAVLLLIIAADNSKHPPVVLRSRAKPKAIAAVPTVELDKGGRRPGDGRYHRCDVPRFRFQSPGRVLPSSAGAGSDQCRSFRLRHRLVLGHTGDRGGGLFLRSSRVRFCNHRGRTSWVWPPLKSSGHCSVWRSTSSFLFLIDGSGQPQSAEPWLRYQLSYDL